RDESVEDGGAFAAVAEEAGLAQDREVARDGRLRDAEDADQLLDRELLALEQAEQPDAGRIVQRPEDALDLVDGHRRRTSLSNHADRSMDFFAAQARVGIRSHRIAPAPSETLPHPSLAATGSLASRVPHGDVAQLVERSVRNAEVRGSTPLVSTSPLPGRRSGPQGEGPEELQEALELVPSGRRSAPASVVHRLTAYSCFRAEHA